MICHSGGAIGSDTIFENLCIENGIEVRAYSYKTPYHTSINKVEISEEDFKEGIQMIELANRRILKRRGISKYMNLLARNWSQVKYSEVIYAIGIIKGNVVDGGTGYAVAMAIITNKPVFVFDQKVNHWFRYSYIINSFIKAKPEDVKLEVENFAGIGTRKINENGIRAIRDLIYSGNTV